MNWSLDTCLEKVLSNGRLEGMEVLMRLENQELADDFDILSLPED